MQMRFFDIDWPDEKKGRGCDKEEGTEKRRLCHCPSCREVRNQIPEELGNWSKGPNRRRRIGRDKGDFTAHHLRESNWRNSFVSMHVWESEGCRNHAATRWLSVGISGQVVRVLDHDEEMGANAWDRAGGTVAPRELS